MNGTRKARRSVLALLVGAALLAACGRRGALELPEPEETDAADVPGTEGAQQ